MAAFVYSERHRSGTIYFANSGKWYIEDPSSQLSPPELIGPYKTREDAIRAAKKRKGKIRYYVPRRRLRSYKRNPMNPDTGAYIAAGVGVLLVAGVGYWLYTKSQASAQAASSPGSYPVAPPSMQPTVPTNPTADYPVVQTPMPGAGIYDQASPLPIPPG